ncbi:MAG TPA: alpha/beta fold hydrolase [Acidimicrobiales bacterium]|nr:alpha/beta fold hydrolase [Acidimicrobiales bacterium]
MSGSGALVLHGFTGTPRSVSGVSEALAGAGFAVEAPLLPGHGGAMDDLVATGWPDWSAAVEDAYLDLVKRCISVVVFGLSLGGSLACWLAAGHKDVAGIVCVNPMIEPVADSFVEMLDQLVASGFSSVPAFGSDIARPDVVEESLGGAPFVPMKSLFAGVAEMAPRLEDIACPLLLFTSRKDHVVPPSSSDYLAARASGPVERVVLERSYHVATLDWDAPGIESRTVAFARKVTATSAA